MKHWTRILVLSICAAMILSGCCRTKPYGHGGSGKTWSARQVAVIENLNAPECVVADPEHGVAYISNIETSTGGYWVDDGEAFISLIDAGGTMKKLRWLDSSPQGRIHAPKGMTILDGYLYFNDNAKLKRCRIATAGPVEVIPVPGAKKLNDLATDGEAVYTTDMELGTVYRIDPRGGHRVIPGPKAINGVTCHKGRLFAVSRDVHEVYELDPAGKKEAKPFGLADQFERLDGVEVMDDGTIIVSDFLGKRIAAVAPDRKTVRTVVKTDEEPADIGIDRKRGLLYVPFLKTNRALVYELSAQ